MKIVENNKSYILILNVSIIIVTAFLLLTNYLKNKVTLINNLYDTLFILYGFFYVVIIVLAIVIFIKLKVKKWYKSKC